MTRIGKSRQVQRSTPVTTGIRNTLEIFVNSLEAIVHNFSAKGRRITVTSSTHSDCSINSVVYSLSSCGWGDCSGFSRGIRSVKKTARTLIAFVALEHLGFLVLEMFLWTSPTGMQVFGLTAELAEQTSTLAANQGLYNGFLSAGLIWSLVKKEDVFSLQVFFLSCVVIAGVFGALTAKPSILFVQGAPAMIALVFVVLANRRAKVTSTLGG